LGFNGELKTFDRASSYIYGGLQQFDYCNNTAGMRISGTSRTVSSSDIEILCIIYMFYSRYSWGISIAGQNIGISGFEDWRNIPSSIVSYPDGTQGFGNVTVFPVSMDNTSPIRVSTHTFVRNRNTGVSSVIYDLGGIIDLGKPGSGCVKWSRPN
jgi:hypothetical protein